MIALRKRFGSLVAVHRRRHGWTQQDLADRAGMSPDMISRIETGGSGARFNTIEKLAAALGVDPAAFFLVDARSGELRRPLIELTNTLASLTDKDLAWVSELLATALKTRK